MLASVAAPLMSITHSPIASGADIAHEPVQDVQDKLNFPKRKATLCLRSVMLCLCSAPTSTH